MKKNRETRIEADAEVIVFSLLKGQRNSVVY